MQFSVDKPLTDPKDDRLGYAPVAKGLAERICKMPSAEGLVISLYGGWGTGKTTMVNFILAYLRDKSDDEKPIVIHFNPWWFSGHEDLVRRFFDQLLAAVSSRKLKTRALRQTIANFAELFSEVPRVGWVGKTASRAVGPRRKDVSKLKEEMTRALDSYGRRILIILDDIDRLTPSEIAQVFRTIKAIGDFPNTIYLLAFDKGFVVRVLGELYSHRESDGQLLAQQYLEKIVQIPLELPSTDKTLLRGLLFEKLGTILSETPQETFDQTYWSNVYLDGIDPFIQTPRDVVRLTNSLMVTYPAVRAEVNPVDFIALDALRVFYPEVYYIVRDNKENFAGYTDARGYFGLDPDALKAFHNAWLKQIPSELKKTIESLIKRLFPKLESVWGNMHYSADHESIWRKQLRAASPEIFPIYFQFAVPKGALSQIEIQSTLALTDKSQEFGSKLIQLANQKQLDGTTRARALLERLQDYTEDEESIPLDRIPSIIQALFEVGDKLCDADQHRRGMFDFGSDVQIGRVVWQLLKRLQKDNVFKVLKDAIENGNALGTIVHEVRVLGQQQGKHSDKSYPEDEWLISADHLKTLESLTLKKIQEAARKDFVLLDTYRLPDVLYAWHEWTDENELRRWVKKVITDPQRLAALLEKFLQETHSQTATDRTSKTRNRLDPEWLKPYLDPVGIIDHVRSLAKEGSLSERQQAAVEQFVIEYDMRQAGKSPNSLFAWRDN